MQHIYAVPRRSALGYVSLDPSLKTADAQNGQTSADLEPVLTAVGAQTEAAFRTVQKLGSDVSQTLPGRLANPSSSSAE